MLGDEKVPLPTDFFRFVVVQQHGEKKKHLSIFVTVERIIKSHAMTYDDERALRELERWFDKNLVSPKRFDRAAAIFWFKPHVAGATALWEKSIALAELLEKYGYRLEIVSTSRPGKIVYDDDVQIAAVPFKDTFGADSSSPILHAL